MKHAQVINTGIIPASFDASIDSIMAFNGANVIDDTDQLPLGEAPHSAITAVYVDVFFWDLMTQSINNITNIPMVYEATMKYWYINVSDVASALTDRRKYVARIVENGSAANMREFTINEFVVDNDSFEQSWMRQPYEIVIGGGEAWMVWYNIGQLGQSGQETYKAPAYEGGVGTTYATDPARVTHRGSIVPFS